VKIERVHATALTPDIAREMAAVSTAQLAAETPDAVPPSAEGMRLEALHGHDDRPAAALWLVRDDDGTLLGHAAMGVTHWDNPELAFVFCSVHPQAHDHGVGTMLLDAQVQEARDLGRSSLLTFAYEDSHRAQFLEANGFTVAQHNAERRLKPEHLDYQRIESLAAEAAHAADDYELVRLAGPTPEDMRAGVATMFEAINDAPLDEIQLDPDVFTDERISAYDAAMAARKLTVYRLMARHRRTGEWGGHTILCVDETRPGYAAQEDTSVLRAHRGHRLGMLLKASMLLWMRDERPELHTIDTWNAVTNYHMIAVNKALGCRVSALGVALQRTL
jgi:GNAT superfamily N-acetyltransferase